MSSLLFDLLEQPAFKEGTHWRKQRYAANMPVFTEGDPGRELYLVLGGRLRVLGKIDLDTERQIHPGFSELTEGSVFGELVLFDEMNRSATVITLSEVELAVIDGNNLLEYMDQHPQIGYPILKELMTVLVGRLRKANQRIFSLFAWGLKSKGLDTLL